ncbi:hypothetical protein [Nitrosomonas communis]|uniref:hypothetical protein n=1 Tax=Nitrosomonas communis TaxID=44574 RepID=UPI003D2C5E5C
MLLRVVLSTVVFTALAKSAVLWAAEPVRLSETQMDAVTAGTVAVGVGAWATADGSNSYTSTSTSTFTFSTPKNNVDIGLGFGEAVACCGSSADTDVQTAYYAEGDRIAAHSTVNNISNPVFSQSRGVVTAIAVDIPSQ